MSQPLVDGSASVSVPPGLPGSSPGSPSGVLSAPSEAARDQHDVDTRGRGDPTAGGSDRAGPEEMAELARGAVSGAVVAWPGGAVSLVGAGLCLIAVIGDIFANPLGMGVFITTV